VIVDAHTHVHPDQDGMGAKYDARIVTLIQAMDDSEVDKAVIYAEAIDVPYVKRVENRYVAECCMQYPDHLIGFASIHPTELNDPAKALEEDVRRYGLKGLKLHPRFQGVGADDPALVPLVEMAVELDIPVAIDALLWKPTSLKIQMPINIDTLCKRVPHARVIISHAGGFHFMDALAVVIANDNVYLEFSRSLEYFTGTPFEDQFVFALKQAGPKKIIYGSDYPQSGLASCFEQSRDTLRRHGFSEEDLAWVFGKTMISLLPGAG
jgi:predicted TIM-barrel fold metal-dependent hydrolase